MKTLKIFAASIVAATALFSFRSGGEWIMVAADNCKIYFPQRPVDQMGTVATDKGELKVNIYSYKAAAKAKDENLAYVLSVTQYPDSVILLENQDQTEAFFKNSVDGIVNNYHGKLLSQSNTTIQGFPGRQVKLDLQQGGAIMNIRFYLVKNTMYMLETITTAVKDPNNSMKRFMNSFEITHSGDSNQVG